jgi:hypothetical protein
MYATCQPSTEGICVRGLLRLVRLDTWRCGLPRPNFGNLGSDATWWLLQKRKFRGFLWPTLACYCAVLKPVTACHACSIVFNCRDGGYTVHVCVWDRCLSVWGLVHTAHDYVEGDN